MKIVVIDGQGGGIGRLVVEGLIKEQFAGEIIAVGTNAMATAAMLRAGAKAGATGENSVRVACEGADVIVGPMGIVLADAMIGEITPAIAREVGKSPARRVLIPVKYCRTSVAGVPDLPLSRLVEEAVRLCLYPAE